jgi:hypothetical protein
LSQRGRPRAAATSSGPPPFTGSVVGGGNAGNGSKLIITRSSGAFAAKSFGAGAPQLFDTVGHQYSNGIDLNVYSGFADGTSIANLIYARQSKDIGFGTDVKYYTSRSLRTSFDSALYAGLNMSGSGKTSVSRPLWPAAYGTQNNQTLYASFWARCSAPFQGAGGGDTSNKIFRVTSGGDDSVRSGLNTADSGGCGYTSALNPYPGNQPNFETLRTGNANAWYRHETWWDNTSGGGLSTAGNLRNDWSGVMGGGNPFKKFFYSGIGAAPHLFEACHPVDVLYMPDVTPSNVWWDSITGGNTFANIILNHMGYDDGHGLSAGTSYDIAQVYYDPNFERPELYDQATWDTSPASTMNREVQGLWTRDSATQITVTLSQGQFVSLPGKRLGYANTRSTAEEMCRFI